VNLQNGPWPYVFGAIPRGFLEFPAPFVQFLSLIYWYKICRAFHDGACAVGEQARGTRVRHQRDVRQMHDLPDAVETSRE